MKQFSTSVNQAYLETTYKDDNSTSLESKGSDKNEKFAKSTSTKPIDTVETGQLDSDDALYGIKRTTNNNEWSIR